MKSVRAALLFSFSSRYATAAVSLLTVVIMARLLTPAQIGVYSVAAGVVALAQELRDFGTAAYLVQEKELTRRRVRSAFGVTLLCAWALAGGLWALAEPFADFYGEPDLAGLLHVLSLNFILIPFGSIGLALIRRDMEFSTLMKITVTASFTQPIVTVGLALAGYTYFALAWGSVANVVATVLLVTLYRPRDSLLLPSLGDWRRVFGFGGQWSVIAMLQTMQIHIVDLILGRLLGFAAVGIYSRANGLMNLYQMQLDAVEHVALPAFSATVRAGRSLKEAWLKACAFMTVFAWPALGFLALMAFPIIRLLFGDQWDAAAPLLRWLALAAAVEVLWHLGGNVLAAAGHVNRHLRVMTATQMLRIAMVVVMAQLGLVWVAAGQVAVTAFGLLLFSRYLHRTVGASLLDVLRASGRSAAVALLSLAVPLAVVSQVGLTPAEWFVPLVIAGAGGGASWLAAVLLVQHPVAGEIRALASRTQARLIRPPAT